MRYVILCLMFLAKSTFCAFGQFGIQAMAGYNAFTDNSKFNDIKPDNSNHFSVGPSYWFRLKDIRIEFNPSVLFDYSRSDYSENIYGINTLKEKTVSINLPIMIYPMDFGNDCHCPTFNKSGHFLQKGFHFIALASLPFTSKERIMIDSNYSKSITGLQLGIGAGLDIGINKKCTISPAIVLSRFFKDSYSISPDKFLFETEGDNRYRIDLLIRFIWFEKSNR